MSDEIEELKELLPCPVCGLDAVLNEWSDVYKFEVTCIVCSISNFGWVVEQEAIDHWNALPRQPKGVEIEGWVARDTTKYWTAYFFEEKPTVDVKGVWDVGSGDHFEVTKTMFPNLTFENSPKKVRISISEVEE